MDVGELLVAMRAGDAGHADVADTVSTQRPSVAL
jgi:hypothetical protein